MEDAIDGGATTYKFRFSIIRCALTERLRESGLSGDSGSSGDQTRAGLLAVLCSWTTMVIGGIVFLKTNQDRLELHSLSRSRGDLAIDAFTAVEVSAAVGALLVIAGSMRMLPSVVRFVLQGGISTVKGHVIRAVVSSILSVAALAGLSIAAHCLTYVQRNGGSLSYSLAFLGTGLLVFTSMVLLTVLAVAVARRLQIGEGALRVESALALATATAMLLMTIGALIWSTSVESTAPWLLNGGDVTTEGIHIDLMLSGSLAMMIASSLIAIIGVSRIASARNHPNGPVNPQATNAA
jgi:hypothetical protein